MDVGIKGEYKMSWFYKYPSIIPQNDSLEYSCHAQCYYFSYGDRLYTSKSDVYRRQILTYKDCPRTERVRVRPHGCRLAASTANKRCLPNVGLVLVQRRQH